MNDKFDARLFSSSTISIYSGLCSWYRERGIRWERAIALAENSLKLFSLDCLCVQLMDSVSQRSM